MEREENLVRSDRRRKRSHIAFASRCLAALVVVLGLASSGHAADEEGSDAATGFWNAVVGGKPTLDVRGRIELARTEGFERSEAYTIRTRLGYGTKPWHGVRVYANFENIAAATQNTYFNPTDPPNDKGQTTIADPPGTELNVGFLEIKRPDWLGSELKGGRQAIVYDDSRFVGDIAWRQNQQTFDAVEGKTSLGLDDLSVSYAWIGHVNRIFGGGGTNPNLRDFDSSSHLIHVSYDALEQLRVSAFAYLFDLELAPLAGSPPTGDPSGDSNQTYGFRANGAFGVGEKLVLDYVASYAFQADFADKATNYTANYVDAGAGIKWSGLGRVGAGFEMLGSDDGVQQFLTPVSTAHKFNGWADLYLNNGGARGLRDLYVTVAPELPFKLKGLLAYHHFWDDASGDVRGNEIDAQLKRPFGKHLVVLAKGAYFNGDDDFAAPDPDTWRFWLDVTVAF